MSGNIEGTPLFGNEIRNGMPSQLSVTHVMNARIENPLLKMSTRNIVVCEILILLHSHAVIT